MNKNPATPLYGETTKHFFVFDKKDQKTHKNKTISCS